jgi:hypothetical protein
VCCWPLHHRGTSPTVREGSQREARNGDLLYGRANAPDPSNSQFRHYQPTAMQFEIITDLRCETKAVLFSRVHAAFPQGCESTTEIPKPVLTGFCLSL